MGDAALSPVVSGGSGEDVDVVAGSGVAAAVAGFLVREPLAVLFRQRYVWREPRAETQAAKRTLGVFGPLLVLAGAALLWVVPPAWLGVLALIGAGLTAAYLSAAVRNRQRSTLLQLAGSFGLTSACALPWLAAGRIADATLGTLALVHAVHSTGGVLTVHARLEAMQAHRGKTESRRNRRAAWVWQALQCAVALLSRGPLLAVALLIPALVHVIDLLRFRGKVFLRTPLKAVGFRELGLSAAVSALTLAALW